MRKWIPLLIIAAAFLATAAVYQDLPQRIPTHWNSSGEVDGWMSRPWGAFVIPLILALQLAIFYLLPKIDPRRANYAKFKGTYDVLIITIMMFMLAVHLLVLATALGNDVPVTKLVPVGAGLLFIVIGNVLPRTRSNWFIGIRTPWTLSSDHVWDRTHRLSGRLFVVAGVLTILAALFLPALADRVLFGSLVVTSLTVLTYSYVIWKRDPGARKVPGPGVQDR